MPKVSLPTLITLNCIGFHLGLVPSPPFTFHFLVHLHFNIISLLLALSAIRMLYQMFTQMFEYVFLFEALEEFFCTGLDWISFISCFIEKHRYIEESEFQNICINQYTQLIFITKQTKYVWIYFWILTYVVHTFIF